MIFVRLAILAALAAADSAALRDPLSGSHFGRIDVIHLSPDVPGRGPCIVMHPDIPGKSPWACLWRDHPLYDEIRDLMLAAFVARRPCTVYWDTADDYGHKTIRAVECWR
ncbi:MAG TPA: hypothetical protein VIK91_00595 [Nannocystis sp.]